MNPELDRAISMAKVAIMTKPQTAFLATVCANLETVVTTDIPTAATDGKKILINPDFFMDLDKERRAFLLAHETLHVIYMHALRREYRDHKKFNHAADYVINSELVNQNFTFIEGGLLDSKYDGMATEQVYKLLQENNDNSGDGNILDDDVQYQDNMSPEEQQEAENDIRNIIVSAATAAEMQGQKASIPPSIQRMLEDLTKPKVNWKIVLRRFMQALDVADYSWRKPRKRFLPLDIYMPSMISEGLSKITFAIDTSGSITNEQFDQFLSEVYAVMKQFKPKIIEVIQFDHALQGHDKVTSIRDLKYIKFSGHGGTLPDVALEAFNKTDSQGLIVITDGEFYTPQVTVKKPVYWCVFNNKKFTAPFGKVVHLDL